MSLLDQEEYIDCVHWGSACQMNWRGKSWQMLPSSGSVFSSSNCSCQDTEHFSLILPRTLKLVFKFTHRSKDSGPHSCWMVQSDFELDPWILHHHPPLMLSHLQWHGGNLNQLHHHKRNDCACFKGCGAEGAELKRTGGCKLELQ